MPDVRTSPFFFRICALHVGEPHRRSIRVREKGSLTDFNFACLEFGHVQDIIEQRKKVVGRTFSISRASP